MLLLCPFDISVGIGAFVIGLGQISSFLSLSWIFRVLANVIMEQRKEVLLQLTKEQSKIISEFINFNNWDLDNILVRNDWETETEQESIVDETTTDTCSAESEVSSPTEEALGGDLGHNNGGGGGGDNDPSNDDLNPGECDFCFCSPCVTSNRQAWLGSGARPHNRNSAIRKVKYRKFWNLLSGAGA